MTKSQKWVALAVLWAANFLAAARAQTFDTLVFGNATSENGHHLSTYFPPPTDTTKVSWVSTPPPSDPSATGPSDVVGGGLGLSARRLLPRTPEGDVYGGQMTFTMAVDPTKQNYFTVRMWGADAGSGFLILDVNGKEVGGRHGTGGLTEDPLGYFGTGWFANRFFYRTELLPLAMTAGRTSVTITIRSLGSIFYYAPIFTYVPQYQHLMSAPSLALYSAYTHAGSIPDETGELQGTPPVVPTPRTLENDATAIPAVESSVNGSFAYDLQAAGSSLSQGAAFFLAECYDAQTNHGASWLTYPAGLTSANVGTQITAALDATVTSYASDATVATNGWGGALGSGAMGDAIRLAWPLLASGMSTPVAYGGTLGTVTRQAGWSAALRASVDSGRYGRQTIANQALDNATNIYYANRALLLVNPANALNETEALRYIKEASGVIGYPWLGNDQASGGTDGLGGGPVPTRGLPPYGPNWYMCTTKGTSKDGNGFVGSDYGEIGTWLYRLGLLSGDAQVQARGLLLTQARCEFRYPGVDESGFLQMMGTDPIGERNNDLPSHYVYLGRGNDDDFLMASQGAAAIGSNLLGYFQEGINDGQMVRNFDYGNPYLPTEWAAIKAMAATNVVLPTAAGQPDYAWVDEENMAVAAKHGEDRFYANLNWRQPAFINGLAKVFHLTPTTANLADVVVDDVRFRPTGQFTTTDPGVDWFATPPDNPVEAFGGMSLPIAWRSDLAAIPANNRDSGRGTGYTLRYGNWLVGINADYSANYTVQLPSDFTAGTDLVSGHVLSGPVVLAPKTSAVFYLPTSVDPNPPPARVLSISGLGGSGVVNLSWYAAGAATSYRVLRATTSGGPYVLVASGVTAPAYTDPSVTNGTTYYYAVQSVNSTGVASGNSPEASVTPVAPQTGSLAMPWADADIGTSTGGQAGNAGGTFTLTSGAGDDYGSVDGCHFVYQPMTGDGVVTARLVSQSSRNTYAKAGLMIRDSLVGTGAAASVNLEPVAREEFDLRGSDGGNSSGSAYGAGFTPPYWVRLVRAGSTISGYVSPDGVTWSLAASGNLSSLGQVAYVGLVVSPANGSSGQTNTAVFDNVTLPLGASAVPPAPTGLTAASGTASATLTWAMTPGAVSYNVKRSLNAGGPFATIAAGVATNAFADFGLGSATYYYVVSAVNGAGESLNSNVAAAVNVPPPAALSGLSVNATGTQAVVSWAASPGAATYVVSRATSYAGPYTVVASGLTADSYTDTGLSAATLYYYKVTPLNSGGSGLGGTISALGTGLPAPWQSQDIGDNVPGGAYATGGVFTLLGNGSSANNHAPPCRYVYQTVSGNGVMATIRLTGQSSANNDVTGLMLRDTVDPGSRYLALDLNSNSSGNAWYYEYRQTTGGAVNASSGYTAAVPGWLRLVRQGAVTAFYTSADGVTWSSLGSVGVSFNPTICVGFATASGDPAALNTATVDNVAVTTDVSTGGTATASADNAANGEGAAQAFDGNTATKWYEPVSPTGWLQYRFSGAVSQAVSQYEVVSANDVPQRDPAAWQLQGSPDGTTWTTLDTRTGQVFANRYQANFYNVTNPTAYPYYRLNVTANSGGSAYGIQLSEFGLFTANASTALVAPAVPLDLSATWSSGQIALSWQATFMAASYNVKRATATGGPYTTIASGLTGTTYTDATVTNGTAYYYVVSAVNAGGESGNSIENSAVAYGPPGVPGGLTTTFNLTEITLAWNAVPGASQYLVARAASSGGPYTTLAIIPGTTYQDSGLKTGTTYYYTVAALTLGELSAPSTPVSAIPLPLDSPWNFAATAGNTVVALTWNPPANATAYAVKRATVSGGPYTTIIGNLPGTSYVDIGLTNGTNYYYLVTPLFASSPGDNSVEVSATPVATTVPLVRSSGGTASGTTAAGDSAQQSPAQAFDGAIATVWSTQVSPTAAQQVDLQYLFGHNQAWAVTQYQLVSSNDAPGSDPAAWQLLASNDGVTWIALDTRSGQVFSGRNTANTYTFPNPAPYRYYQLDISANSGGSNYGLELAECVLFSAPADAGDKTAPGFTLPGNPTATATSAAGAIVNYSVSAQDAVTGALPATVSPVSGSQFPIGTSSVQCSAIDLAGNTGTAQFNVTVTSPAVASASAGISGSGAAQAFDGSTKTKWYNGVKGGTGYLQFQFASYQPKTVAGYAITSAADTPQRDPAAWQFEGSPDGVNWTVLDTRAAQIFSARSQTLVYNFANPAAYAYYRLNITANSGGAAYGVQLAELTFLYALPPPWATVDIGAVGAAGAAGSDSGAFTCVAAGTDITGTSDALRYTYESASGDCDIRARVLSFTSAAKTMRMGVMIRESLNANSRQATTVLTPGSGVVTRYRSSTGGATTSSVTTGLAAPYWVRVTRAGNYFTFYRSPDGVTWTSIKTAYINMASNVYIGLAATSGAAGTLTISTLDNVTPTP